MNPLTITDNTIRNFEFKVLNRIQTNTELTNLVAVSSGPAGLKKYKGQLLRIRKTTSSTKLTLVESKRNPQITS